MIKSPNIILGRGERVEKVRLKGNALRAALQWKLVEEAFEALDAKSAVALIGELADIQEVIRALCRTMDVDEADIETERQEKEKRRGGFEKGLMLLETSTPHSIRKPNNRCRNTVSSALRGHNFRAGSSSASKTISPHRSSAG